MLMQKVSSSRSDIGLDAGDEEGVTIDFEMASEQSGLMSDHTGAIY